MKKFYLNHNFSNPLSVEISPTLVETLDESLDNMTITLGINADRNPYAPALNVVGVYEEDENQNRTLINEFVISSDNVELATENPLRYKHTVSLIQKSQFLTKHLIRNNVFSNSLEYSNNKTYLTGGNFYWDSFNERFINHCYGNYFSINLEKNKIKKMVFRPDFLAFVKFSTDSGGSSRRFNVQPLQMEKWTDLFQGLSDEYIKYPLLIFIIGNESRTWTLDDFYLQEELVIPNDILQWIQSKDSGVLQVRVLLDLTSNLGWVTTPYTAITVPVYGKLTFDINLDYIETSVYSVIEQLINQYKKNTKAYNDHTGSSGYDSTIKPLFKMPDSTHHPDLYELLTTTQAPNFIFTQSSMFDALSEIFRLFDATFRIDEDGYLEIEYFNDRDYDLKFEMTDSKQAGRSSSLGEERYANRLVTYYQNTQINDKFPNSNNVKATAYLRSKTLGVPGMSDFVFEVPKPIYYINKVKINAQYGVSLFGFDVKMDGDTYQLDYYTAIWFYKNSNYDPLTFDGLVDITSNVVESKVWSTLPASGTNNPFEFENYQENTLSYTQGTKYIEVANYYQIKDENLLTNVQKATLDNVIASALCRTLGTSELDSDSWRTYTLGDNNWRNVKMSVDYVALVDGKLVNESIDNKYDGEILTNQNNGSIDIYKLGLNMVGLSLKLGQPTLTMIQRFTNWENRIKKGQWFVDQTDGSVWVANTCSYILVTNEVVEATIEFVKNFNALASRIELNREKRLTNISNELTVKCEENYGEFIYFTDNINYILPTGQTLESIAFLDYFIQNSIISTLGSDVYGTPKVEYAIIDSLDLNNNVITLEKGDKIEKIAVPMVVYGSGSSVCFEMSFESPISAGTQLLDSYNSIRQSGSSIGNYPGWYSRSVLYSYEDGTADKFTINFIDLEEDISRLFPVMKKQITTGSDYSESNLTPLSYTTHGKLEEFEYFKKPNEIFALNYQLHFLPYGNGCFLGQEFIKNNAFSEGLNKKKLRIAYTLDSTGFEYSVLDTKAVWDYDCYFDWDDVSITTSEDHKITITIPFTGVLPLQVKTWAIVDENDNIYFASNNGLRRVVRPGQLPKFYIDLVFFWRHHRLI